MFGGVSVSSARHGLVDQAGAGRAKKRSGNDMAKSFSSAERAAIRQRLFAVGLNRFSRQGIRGVRVADLCKDTGIAKGTFYTFFSSKEELFMAIARQRDEQHKKDMWQYLAPASGTPKQRAAGFFDLVMGKIKTDPMLHIVTDFGDLEYLLLRVSPQLLAEIHAGDKQFSTELSKRWNALKLGEPIKTATLEGLMTLMVALYMQHRTMPAENMANTIDLLREIFVERLTKKTSQ